MQPQTPWHVHKKMMNNHQPCAPSKQTLVITVYALERCVYASGSVLVLDCKVCTLQTELKPPQPSGLEGIELAAALSHLSSQSARLDREASLTATYDQQAQDATSATPPQSASSYNSQLPRLDEASQLPMEPSSDSVRMLSDRTPLQPSTVLLNTSLFGTTNHIRSRPSTAPSAGQHASQLTARHSLPVRLIAGEAVAVPAPDSGTSEPGSESGASSVSWPATAVGQPQPGAYNIPDASSLPRASSGSAPGRSLQASRSLPLARQSLVAARRPVSAPSGSRVLPTVPENEFDASHCMPLHVPLPLGPGSSLHGSSSRSASDLVGSECVSVSGLEHQPWDSYPGASMEFVIMLCLVLLTDIPPGCGGFPDYGVSAALAVLQCSIPKIHLR